MDKNGVIYYKLVSSYDGDITKNCGLTGGEIDGNFLFLRGYDIENALWDNESKVLSFTRINGEKIVVDGFNFETNVENSYYDSKNGELVLNVNGNEHRISGFYVNENVESTETVIYTDSTIEGDGSINSPLSVNDLTKTGFYSAIKAYVDVCNDEILPSNPKLGDKYLTKEPVSNYGLLYNFDGVKAVQQTLDEEGSSWHIPTNKEWGEMLNALELCDEDRTHLGQLSNRYYGKNAGDILKADTYEWMRVNTTSVSDKDCLTTEDNILPTASQEKYEETFLGGVKYEISGISEDDSVVYHQYICKSSWKEDESNVGKSSVSQDTLFKALPVGTTTHLNRNSVQSIGKLAGYWTIDQDGETDAWVRVLEYNTGKVRQQSESTDSYYSLRLVRDYENDAKGVEIINGLPYNTILMPYVEIDENGTIIKQGTRVWTAENVSFIELLDKDSEYQALKVTDNNNEISLDGRFFLNKWNGEEWEKLLLDDNTLLILNEGPDKSINEEWRINKGEIRKRITEIANKVTKEMSEVIDGISENHVKDIKKLNENVSSLKDELDRNITKFTNSDDALTDKIYDVERKVDEEVLGRTNAYTELRESIEGIKNDFGSSLSGNVDELNSKLVNLEKTLISEIENEAKTRISKDEELQMSIDNNKTFVNEQISEINENINSVNTSVSTSHKALNTKIDNVDKKLVGEFATLSGKVDENTSKLNDVISEINTRINKESSDRIAANTSIEGGLSTTIENVRSTLSEKVDENTAEIDSIKSLLSDETTNRQVEDDSIRKTISSLDTKLSNQIESTKCDVESYVDGKVSESYTELDEKIRLEKNERKEEDSSIRNLVNDKFNEVKNSIEKEIKNREDKDKEVFEDINTKYSEFCDLIDGINDDVNVAKGDISIIKKDVEYIQGEMRGIKQQQEENNSSLQIEIIDIDRRLDAVENSYATKGELLSESNRAISAESNINNKIGDGFNGKTITKILQDLIDKNEIDVAAFTNAIGKNTENIKDLDDRIKAFLNDADISSLAIDTLKEIQDFISDNGEASAKLLDKINQVSGAVANAQKSANDAQRDVDLVKNDYLKSSDKSELLSKIDNNKHESNLKFAEVNSEFVKVRNEFANADNLLKVELKNGYETAIEIVRETADNAQRDVNFVKNDYLKESDKSELLSTIKNNEYNNTLKYNEINSEFAKVRSEFTNADNVLKTDIKNNYEAADVALKSKIDEQITKLMGDISNIEGTNNSNVSSLNAEINSLKIKDAQLTSDITTLKEKSTSFENNITTLTNNVNVINNEINEINEGINLINNNNKALETKIDNEINRAKNAEESLRALIGSNTGGGGTSGEGGLTKYDVNNLINDALDGLDVNSAVTSVTNADYFISEVTQEDGKVQVKKTSFNKANIGVNVEAKVTEDIEPAEDSPFGKYLKDNGIDTIPKGSSYTEVLKMLLSPEVWPSVKSKLENTYTNGMATPIPNVRLEAKKDDRGYLDLVNTYDTPYEVGTKIYLVEAKANEFNANWLVAYHSGMTYGYECEDGTKSDETKIQTKFISSRITGGNYKLTIRITSMGDETINKMNQTMETEAEQASSCAIKNCSLGCLGVGKNTLLLNQISPSVEGEFKSDIEQNIYPLSNHGNRSKTPLEPLKGGTLKYESPKNSDPKNLYGYYKFFVGTTEKLDTKSFSSDEIRKLEYSGFMRYDNEKMERPDETANGSIITYGYSNKNPIVIEGTNKSLVIAFPVGYDRHTFALTKAYNVKNFNILPDFECSTNPVIVKCGDKGIETEYYVYLFPNPTGEPLSLKDIEISDIVN